MDLVFVPPWRADVEDVDTSPMDRRVQTRWITPPRLAAIALSFAIAAAGILAYVRYGLVRTLSVEAQRVVISPVTAGSFHDYVPVTGNVQPRETVYLDAVDGGPEPPFAVRRGEGAQQAAVGVDDLGRPVVVARQVGREDPVERQPTRHQRGCRKSEPNQETSKSKGSAESAASARRST